MEEQTWIWIEKVLPRCRQNFSLMISRSREVRLRIHFEHTWLVDESVFFIARGDVVEGCVDLLD